MPENNKLKAVDFFCGAGGVTRGFKDAGINVLAGIDIDDACEKTYQNNNDGAIFLNKDIATYSPEELQNELGIKPNDDNLIFVGCSPCQYYTYLNTSKQKSEKSKMLLEEFQRFVAFFQPGYIFIENVPGLEKKAESPLKRFKEYLKANGYSFSDKVINAKYFGVPQNRRRYVMIASRINKVEIPEPNKKRPLVTVKDAIGNTAIYKPVPAGNKDNTDFLHSTANIKDINLKRLENTSKDGGSRTEWAHIEDLQLNCYKTHAGHTDGYGRMAWNKVSPTITTKFNSISNGRYGHPEQNRAISLREGATLQSFPVEYKFYASNMGNIARMIGNAVPPNLACSIANAIKSNHNGQIQQT